MKYTEKQFLETWKQVKTDLRKILSLVRHMVYDRETGIHHINFIQDYLYKRNVIPFKVNSEQDYHKIDKFKGDNNIILLLEYFCLANTELKKLRNEISKTSRI